VADVSIVAGALGGIGKANGTGTFARFASITDLAYEPNGNILVADREAGSMRRVTPAGGVSDVANGFGSFSVAVKSDGSVVYSDSSQIFNLSPGGVRTALAGSTSAQGTTDGLGSLARLLFPAALTLASDGTLYFLDTSNRIVRKMSPAGLVTTIAGQAGISGNLDGVGSAARFNFPTGLALSNNGARLYVSDTSSHRIRVIDLATNTVSHFAGDPAGRCGTIEGPANTARFCDPTGIRMTAAGTLLVADRGSGRIRAITAAGVVSTLAGAPLDPATGLVVTGNPDGPAASAGFTSLIALAVSPDGLSAAIGDRDNPVVRVLNAGAVSSLAGSKTQDATVDGPGADARFSGAINALAALPNGTMVAAQTGGRNADQSKFRRISATGSVSSDAGTAPFVSAMASNSVGDVYYASDRQVFQLSSSGVSTAVAGSASTIGFADGTGTAARFQNPKAMVATADGTVYVAEQQGFRIRKITPAGVVSTLAGNGTPGTADGTGPAARLDDVQTMVLDSSGNLLVGSYGRIRKVTPAGVVTTVSSAVGCYGGATIDAANNLYCSQQLNTITRVSPAGVETVLVAAPNDDSFLFRTGTSNASLNRIHHLKLLSETATSLVFAVASDNERVIVRATVAK
jgi:sugar lactone lactonase YvrE